MQSIETLILLMLLIVGCSIFARRLNIIFPVLLTVTGLLLSLIPGFPKLFLDPAIVLLVFLPPILYSAAWNTNWVDFKKNIEPISTLSIGLVIVTTIVIGFVARALLPGFTLGMGFLLGAIISPPDAVAATSVFKHIKIPKRIVTILEGESLVNDASALITFQFALTSIFIGSFSLSGAIGQFIMTSAGGVGIGCLVGYLSLVMHKKWKMDTAIETGLTFVTAYGSYVLAEEFHFSGVLSVVAAGLFVGNKQAKIHSAKMRLQSIAVWNFTVVLLQGLIFILIGLQLPFIASGIKDQSILHIMKLGAIISLAAILIRFIFVFVINFLTGKVRSMLKMKPLFPSRKHDFVVAYAGIRGVVSVAAAFSIPLFLQNGSPFPQRNLILFIVFCVIIFTLVLQGLTLPWIIRKLDFSVYLKRRQEANFVLASLSQAALDHVEDIIKLEKLDTEAAHHVRDIYTRTINQYSDCNTQDEIEQRKVSRLLMLEAVKAKRKKLHDLRQEEDLDHELFLELQNELDLDEARLLKLKIN
jgi:CPA1 family monovalent cation:H+ antiporter